VPEEDAAEGEAAKWQTDIEADRQTQHQQAKTELSGVAAGCGACYDLLQPAAGGAQELHEK
jgi:hypothetical protein